MCSFIGMFPFNFYKFYRASKWINKAKELFEIVVWLPILQANIKNAILIILNK